MKPIFKRMLSGVLSAVIALSATPIVSAYEEIQNDTDGDLDDDGLINGEEVHLDKTTTNSRLISMTSDPRVADYDRDGFNDKQEVKNNTNPYRFNIASGDVDYLTNNEQFLASSYSDDYIHSKALKAQLAAGNALFRFKLKYTQDYEIALSNYFVTAAKVLSCPEVEENLKSTTIVITHSLRNGKKQISTTLKR